MQMPRNGFDNLAAVARLNTDSTLQHRQRWPSLAWVWDELDELRANADQAIDNDDHEEALDDRDNALEQRNNFSQAIRLLLEPDPDMDQVQAVLAGYR